MTMKSTKNVLDNETMVAEATEQNKKIADMLARGDEVVASNNLKEINEYLSTLKEMGGMLPKSQLKHIADGLAINVTDDLSDITYFIKLYGQYGAISPKLIKRIMIQYNKASEAEFLTYFADMVSGMTDADLDRLIAESETNPKLTAVCKRIKKRRQATQTVSFVEMQRLEAYDVPAAKKANKKRKAKAKAKEDEETLEDEATLAKK